MNRNKGFTLIELLIVITIIGILAVALLPRLLEGPARARDTARTTGLNNLATILHTYNQDYGRFPIVGTGAGDSCTQKADGSVNAATTSGTTSSSIAGMLVEEGYLTTNNFPKDPQNGSNQKLCNGQGGFWYKAIEDSGVANAGFIIAADVENDNAANLSATGSGHGADKVTTIDSAATAFAAFSALTGSAKRDIKDGESVFALTSR